MTMLMSVRAQMADLETKKKQVSALMGTVCSLNSHSGVSPAVFADDQPLPDLAGLLDHVTRSENTLESFAGRAGNPFDSIPVCRPVPASAAVSVAFGQTRDPFTNKNKWHYGIDFAAPEKTPVFAAASGQVIKSENDQVWGKRVIIDHRNGFTTVYAHLGKALVAKGRRVKRGEVIGEIGYSGLTTGPHVHYEIRNNSVAVDPEKFFFPLSAASR
jgi:murein DD-endopeptidase MepM/ murein hydrolase activator NlpD